METRFKKGDTVLVRSRTDEYIAKVGNVTPTGRFQLEGQEGKYRPKYDNNGHEIGDIWSQTLVSLATLEDIQRINHNTRIKRLKNTNWEKDFTPEAIQEIWNLVKSLKNKDKALKVAEEQKKPEAPKDE